MTSRNPSAACSLGNEDVFDKFLDVLRHLYGQTHESITKDSWRAHCQLQLSVRDTRSPILCEAAAFVALPFHLRPEGRRKVEEEVDKKPAKEVRSDDVETYMFGDICDDCPLKYSPLLTLLRNSPPSVSAGRCGVCAISHCHCILSISTETKVKQSHQSYNKISLLS